MAAHPMVNVEHLSELPTIIINRSPADQIDPETARAVDEAWNGMLRENSRYFNGPMLVFNSFDERSNKISASVGQYKHHAVRDSVNLDMHLLAVTGVVAAPDTSGVERYLIGTRSPKTHRYGNLLEFGPCGGIDVPPQPATHMHPDDILQELGRESIEEAGLDLSIAQFSPIALIRDNLVGSVDIVVRARLDSIPELSATWEYTQTQWMTSEQIKDIAESTPERFIPTAISIAQMLI
ncbi:MAG: hypothetical protein AB8C13_04620 [Phycisphaerales bacterium]